MINLMDWAWACTMLMQAMLGNISDNVRAVSLTYDQEWHVSVYIKEDKLDDRDAAEDIASEFAAFLYDVKDRISPEAYAQVKLKIVVTTDELPKPQDQSSRTIFQRREESR